MLEEALEIIRPWPHFRTGSSVTVDPPVTDTDIDIVVVYSGDMSHRLQGHGFEITPHEEYPNEQIKAVYRKGNVNIIAVDTREDYERWLSATKLATAMNLTEKRQRILLFQFLTEGHLREDTSVKLLPPPIDFTDML
jgi:hypothetical protein